MFRCRRRYAIWQRLCSAGTSPLKCDHLGGPFRLSEQKELIKGHGLFAEDGMGKVSGGRDRSKGHVQGLSPKPGRPPINRDTLYSATNDQSNGRPNDYAQPNELHS